MARPSSLFGILALAGALAAPSPVASQVEPTSVSAGRLVAQRHCATCHAIADGESPMRDAPAFARLRYRYGPGGLSELLAKGMIKDWPTPLEEGSRPLHPRMPAVELSVDEVAALTAYLQSVAHDPRGDPAARRK